MAKSVNRDINSRVKEICDIVFGGNLAQMAKATYISRTSLISIIGEQQSAPGYDILRKIVEMPVASINPTWLLTGEGPMVNEEVPEPEPKVDLVPELPVYAAAGFTDDIDNGITPTVCIMRPRVQDLPAYDLTLTVWGDSMSPTFESGDRLALRRCANITEWGMPHVVDTTEGVYVKRIKDAGECISCTSDNAAYPPFDIPKSCIRGIYKVVALLRVC